MASYTVESSDGIELAITVYDPILEREPNRSNIAVVLVHPYSILGGCQNLLTEMACRLGREGYKAVTFDMRGVGKSSGRASLTGSKEIKDVVAVCDWVAHNLSCVGLLLVGSSAGAAICGPVVDNHPQVVGYVSLGYPFGFFASILFGRHQKAILKSTKPKLFIMGTRDCFTTVKQLQRKLKSACGRNETYLMEGVTHFQMFQMEGTDQDEEMTICILEFIASL